MDAVTPLTAKRDPEADNAGPRPVDRVLGAVMVAVLAFGIWQGIAAMRTPSAERRFADTLNTGALLAGRTAAAVNYVMAHYLPADGVLRAAGGIFRWRLFHSGGPQVFVGCDDWLYLTEELRPWPDADAAMRDRADLIRQVAAGLKAKGIDLLVALVPDKARVQAATLCHAPRAAQTAGRYAAFSVLLQQAGLAIVDLNAALADANRTQPVFYRTDTHWNQVGAAIAARAIAASVKTAWTQDRTYRTEAAAEETDGPGDLLRLMSLDQVADTTPKLRPSPDRQYLEHTTEVAAPAESGGLLDDGPAVDVALIGSSFSLNANFHGRLQEALRAAIVNFGEAGGGFAGAANTYLHGATFRETPPKLVIWELPERFVGQALTDADRRLLTP